MASPGAKPLSTLEGLRFAGFELGVIDCSGVNRA